MTLTPLTPPPAAPSRSDQPATFITRADAFINWWSGTFTPEFNALLPEIVLAGSANNYGATSTTSLTVGTGSKSLTVQTDKAFQVGQFVQISNTATPANYMFGQVTAYNASTGALTVNVSSVGGSGTFTAWTIGLAATGGAYAQLSGAAFSGNISAPQLNIDTYFAAYLSSGDAFLSFDSNDYLGYYRSTNTFSFKIAGSPRLEFSSTTGNLYGDWTVKGVTYFNNDASFTAYLSGGNPTFLMDAGDGTQFDRINNQYTMFIGNITRHTFTATQHLIGSDPVVTRTSTDTLTNKTLTAPTINSAALNPSGSAPLYPARARVSFNGSGTVTITDSANVSSITDNGVGDYTVNFTTAMPNANYQWTGNVKAKSAGYVYSVYRPSTAGTKTTTALQISVGAVNNTGASADDSDEVCIVIYG